jgi:hypothetical protein
VSRMAFIDGPWSMQWPNTPSSPCGLPLANPGGGCHFLSMIPDDRVALD